MFTGIIRSKGWVLTVEEAGNGRKISVRCPQLEEPVTPGDSIAVNGVCLTAETVEPDEPILHFHLVEETLERSTLDRVDVGDLLNIEPSLRAGDPLGGHFVMGHVDGIGHVDQIEKRDEEQTLWVEAPESLLDGIVSKGCIAIDGVSLTPVQVEENRFSVVLIPETLRETTLGQRKTGEPVNLELDLIARYVRDQLEPSNRNRSTNQNAT